MYKGLDLTKITMFDMPNLNTEAYPLKSYLLIYTLEEAKKSRLDVYKKSPAQRVFDLIEYAQSIGDKGLELAIEKECSDVIKSFFRL